MSNSTERADGRVNKREYVSRVARRAGVPVRVATSVYEAAIEEILSIVSNGGKLTLTGFGKFYPQAHKGHRVQFGDEEGTAVIDDYAVLKFSATRTVNQKVRVEAVPKKVKGESPADNADEDAKDEAAIAQ